MRLQLALALTVVAAGAAAEVTSFETQGNLGPTMDPGCVTMAAADARLSPPDLARGVLACGRDGNWETAAELYVLMLLRSSFDVRRVADPTAHQAGEVLTMQLTEAQPEADRARLGEAIQRVASPNATQRDMLCKALLASGVPQHDPSWMIQHGMAAFTGLQGDGLVPGVDPAELWQQVLQVEVACG